MEDLTTEIWRLSGMTGSDPGMMSIEGGVVSFLQPQNTRPLAASYGAAAGVASISGGRKAGKAWKALLASG